MKGYISDYKRMSVHDGPGIRTTLFLKGCPLRCRWCHNPENLRMTPTLSYTQKLCVGCGACAAVCERGVHRLDALAHHIDFARCTACGACVKECYTGALKIFGQEAQSEDAAEKLLEDRAFYESSAGGVTFSGGEPLAQADFVHEAIQRMRPLHVAIETSGYATHDVYRRVIQDVDLVYQDVKLADPEAHRKWTGADNSLILKNLAWLKTSGKPFVARIPLIPGVTDTAANFAAVAELLKGSVNLREVQLLPYNFAAGAKYALVGREYKPPFNENTPVNTDLTVFKQASLPCRVM